MTTLDFTVTEIDAGAFRNANNLTTVVISDSVVRIGIEAFLGCRSLESVTLGSGYYGAVPGVDAGVFSYNMFYGCLALKEIVASESNPYFVSDENGVLYSKDRTVLYCYPAAIERNVYTVPGNVKSIYSSAFAYGIHLRRIIISGNGLANIGDSAFVCCSALEDLYLKCKVPICGNNVFGEVNENLIIYYNESFYESWQDYTTWHGFTVKM